jgi:4-amino-4-deoxy-L-arabinose transferase-like glycosyltransferase
MSPVLRASGWGACALTFLFLVASTWIGHSDAGDGQVYQVVARHLAEDGQWLSLRYLPALHPVFREHLPFSFWLMAAVIRVVGEGALAPLFAGFSLGVVLLTGYAARRLAGDWAALVAMLVLATTMHFFKDAGHPLLDPLLLFFATASALPVLLGTPRLTGWLAALALAAAATAVKGPFGVLPLVGAAVARAALDRSWRPLLAGAAVTVAALLPTFLFLRLHRDWWEGYFLAQVLASATGQRTDGILAAPLYPLKVLAGRFWPGLALLPLGFVAALGWPRALFERLSPVTAQRPAHRRAARLLLLQALVVVAALTLPGRKVWHHTLIVYPTLAALAGVGVGPWLDHALSETRRARWAVAGLGVFAALALGASLLGIHRLYLNPPCAVSQELAQPLAHLAPDSPVLIVSDQDEWDLVSALAVETRLVPWPAARLDANVSSPPASVALVAEHVWAEDPAWTEVARGRGWVMAERVTAR